MKGIIIGAGEVGRSIHRVLIPYYETKIIDKGESEEGDFQVMHVCYPYHDAFLDTTKAYADRYNPDFIVIHSTVKPGTTRKAQELFPDKLVVHTPVEGRHPDLSKSALNWQKPIGSVYSEVGPFSVKQVEDYFHQVGILTRFAEQPENTEVGKIMSTTMLGFMVIFARIANRVCEASGANYEHAIEQYTRSYNSLYSAMGMSQYTRPVLYPSEEPIGGHCVMPNLELIDHPQMAGLKAFIHHFETKKEPSPMEVYESQKERVMAFD